MAIGAYSIIRYCNSLRDERVNLGVLLWHPKDGMSWRISPSLDRIKAVNPLAHTDSIRDQLKIIEQRAGESGTHGRELLDEFSQWLREGLEVSAPYPARIGGLGDETDRLFRILVSRPARPDPLFSERAFQRKFAEALLSASAILDPRSPAEDLGSMEIDGLPVYLGIHTKISSRDTLWRALSLRTSGKRDRIARTKATLLDIGKIKSSGEFDGYRQIVTVQIPKGSALETFNGDESVRWLRHGADDVLAVPDVEQLAGAIEHRLESPW